MKPRSARKEASRARILHSAKQQLCAKGLHGIGLAALMGKAGLTHGGFYAHFPSKQALYLEAVDSICAETHDGLRDAADAAATPDARRRAIAAAYLRGNRRGAALGACAIAALGVEAARGEPALRRRLQHWIEESIRLLQCGQPGAADRGNAIRLFSSLVGAAVLAGAVQSRRQAGEIINCVATATALRH
jgi:TetR/AcrR family transcriptional repressor of nem operon